MTNEERATTQQKANQFIMRQAELLKELGLIMQVTIHFSKATKVPLLSQFCLWLVNRQGGKFDFIFGPDKASYDNK